MDIELDLESNSSGKTMQKSPDYFTIVRNYWEKLRAGRLVPERSEIDPRAISIALEHAFILERTPAESVRFRIAGSAITEYAGLDLRGMPIGSLIGSSYRQEFDSEIEKVFARPEIQEFQLATIENSALALDGRLLLLPLESDEGQIDRAIGCFEIYFDGQPTTRKLIPSACTKTNLRSGEKSTRQFSSRPNVHGMPGMYENQQSFDHQPNSSRPSSQGRPEFKVITGGKLDH